MKKALRIIIILFICFIPMCIKAFTYNNYNNSKITVRNYINKYSDRNKYLIFNMPYDFSGGNSVNNTSFTTGGLLSKSEYDISKGGMSSYLAIGREYWTLSSYGSNQYYVDHTILYKNPDNVSGARVTEFVKPNTIIIGKGTYANPWEFVNQNSVTIRVDSSVHGKVSLKTPTNYVSTINKMVKENNELEFRLKEEAGYEYSNSDCNIVKTSNVSNNEYIYKTQPISQDTICTINYKKRVITISYACTGGSGTPPASSTFNYGSNYTIADYTGCSKVGYTFSKWLAADNTSEWAKGSYTNFNIENGSRGLVSNRLSLKPKWTANTYSLDFNLDRGTSVGTLPTTATYDSPITINFPTKSVTASFSVGSGITASSTTAISKNYEFNGWSITNMDNTVHKIGSTTTSVTSINNVKETSFTNLRSTAGVVTFTATWKAPSITLPTITKEGHTCIWTSGSYTWSSGGTYTPDNAGGATSRTFTASCTPNTYTVTFNSDGGTGGQTAAVSVTYGSAMPAISTTAPTKTGYTFGGWYYGSTQYYTAAGASARNYNRSSNTELKAKWTAKTYTLSFNCNSGSGGPSSITVTYGQKVTNFPTGTCTRSGYAFTNWYENTSGTGTQWTTSYANGYTWNKTSNLTLYAAWKGVCSTANPEACPSTTPCRDAGITSLYDSNGYSVYAYDAYGNAYPNAYVCNAYTLNSYWGMGGGVGCNRATKLYILETVNRNGLTLYHVCFKYKDAGPKEYVPENPAAGTWVCNYYFGYDCSEARWNGAECSSVCAG